MSGPAYTTDQQLARKAMKMKIPLNCVCSKDRIPPELKNGGYIINLQDSDAGSGTHWVALWISGDTKGGTATYFDSYGIPPPRSVLRACQRKTVNINYKEIQSMDSGHCGHYCLSFILWMYSRGNLRSFQGLFSPDPEDNLRILNALLLDV